MVDSTFHQPKPKKYKPRGHGAAAFGPEPAATSTPTTPSPMGSLSAKRVTAKDSSSAMGKSGFPLPHSSKFPSSWLILKFLKLQLQADKSKPSFYDVSLVDGYNLPVSVSAKPASKKCQIGGCQKNLKNACPEELQILNKEGEVAACKSACLAFNDDKFCCRNEFGSPETCKPSVYSKIFKDACPSYFSYAFDTPTPLVNCPSDAYVITFCPSKWG
ncbi:hypothetical protein C3L33_18897, partial [Rhododendron williamsianum]